MGQVLVRGIDEAVIERLRRRARNNGRSLEAELRLVLKQAAGQDMAAFRQAAARIRKRLEGREHTDSAVLIREDRDR